MQLKNAKGHIYIPDGSGAAAAMQRTTHLCIAAHQDDVEIMAYGPIVECYNDSNKFFSAVVITDGAGSPRDGKYASMTDEDMQLVRRQEQDAAAKMGRYSAMLQLGYPSKAAKASGDGQCAEELAAIIKACAPEFLFTHNLADKHDTHVGVALRTIEAIRSLPMELRPKKLYSMEVWRGLDWLLDSDKVVFNTDPEPQLASDILAVFESQCAGGKRYDLAAIGRRVANATFFASHAVDTCNSCSYALDITALILDDTICPVDFIKAHIDSMRVDVEDRLARMK
ncbi:MAG: PIG-L family deacetylase [Oscillospiraceae bacterium]|nr:PIG-L family deacetylase [Oscillospiraceae bacterium]